MTQEKINIVELLKDCPTGMELDCTMFDNIEFVRIEENNGSYPIICRVKAESGKYHLQTFTKYGCYSSEIYSKCVIYPKGKTTWEEFVPYCKFKDGDVVATDTGAWIGITTGGENTKSMPTYCVIKSNGCFEAYLGIKNTWQFSRLATKEEKTKLFDAIKANGYKWNAKTKTLDKLVGPNFKVGNWITNGDYTWKVISVDNFYYTLQNQLGEYVEDTIDYVNEAFHLWTIQDAKDGDVIFYDDGWACIFKCIHGIWYSSYCFITSDGEFNTGYEEHAVDAKINGNAHPATKEQCNLLFQKITENGYKWCPGTKTLEKLIIPKFKVGDYVVKKDGLTVPVLITGVGSDYYSSNTKNSVGVFSMKEQDDWELVSNKFDINTLTPFESRVLVRDYNTDVWRVSFWGCLINNRYAYNYDTTRGYYKQCIPYEGNEHLLGKTDDCIAFYKTWK